MATTDRKRRVQAHRWITAMLALGGGACEEADAAAPEQLAVYALAADGGEDGAVPQPPDPTEPPTFGSVAACDGAWGSLQELTTQATEFTSRLSAGLANGQLCVLVEGSGLDRGKFNLFLEVDAVQKTGYQPRGADYMFDHTGLYGSTGSGFDWGPVTGSDAGYARTHDQVKFRIAVGTFGAHRDQQSIGVGFNLQDSGFNDRDKIPTSGKLLRTVTPTCTLPVREYDPIGKCTRPGADRSFPREPSFDVGSGMIIPAYLRVEPTEEATWPQTEQDWAQLATGAANATAAGVDYWVAVTGPGRGPFADDAPAPGNDDWADAANVWKPIQAKGGRLFGYIHTCRLEPGASEVGPYFRSLYDVEEAIAQWVCGYPDLDGIWIDEFNPRFELNDTDGTLTDPPNGDALAPIDRGPDDVDPACGYYDRLRSWVRKYYPHLRLIGNAGGALRNNQFRYAELVDVLVSVEESLVNARAADGLRRPDRTPSVENAKWGALVHGVANSSDMKSIIGEAFDAGYSHVYATDIEYVSTESNVWGFLPTPAWSMQEGIFDRETEQEPAKLRPSFLLEVDEFVKRRR